MNLIFLAYIFPPLGGGGVQRSQKFVELLPQFGWLPTVITGPGLTDSRWTPRDSTLHVPPEICVVRVSGQPDSKVGSFRRRFERCLALPSGFGRWWTRSASRVASSLMADVEVIFATMSPFESAAVASEVSRTSGKPWVADLRDPWALDETVVYLSRLHRNLEITRMVRVLSTASAIIMNTPEAARALTTLLPENRRKSVVTITNGFDREDFSAEVPARTDRKFRIVHSGTWLTDTGLQVNRKPWHRLFGGAQQGADILTRSPVFLLQAIQQWQARDPESGEHLELVFAGVSSATERDIVHNFGVHAEISFPGYIPHSESVALVRTADLLFLPMHTPSPGRCSLTVPAKTYEYMASERPILAAVPDGDAKDYLKQCGTAFVCGPADVAQMAVILDRIYSDWKAKKAVVKPNQAFLAQFERRFLTQRLADVLEQVLLTS
jgi:glycosyltransferase involved in cell wall biosynthesis